MAQKKFNINLTYLALGAGVAAGVAIAAYFIWRKHNKTPSTSKDEIIAGDKIETFDQKYTRVISKINKIYLQSQEDGQLSRQLMRAIYQGHYQLASDEARQLILKARRKRRRNMHNKAEYISICENYQQQLEELMDKHLGAILARFHINKTFWMEQTNLWSNSDDGQEWGDLLRVQDEKQLDCLRNKALKPRSFAMIKNALEYKIKQLEVFDSKHLFADKEMEQSNKYTVLQSYIDDLVYEKFALEQEDIEYSISTFNGDMKDELEPLYDLISELMTGLLFSEDENEDEDAELGGQQEI